MNQNILGDKKKSNFDDNLANIVNEIYDKMPDVVVPEKKSITPGNFYVEELDDRYVLHCVKFDYALLNVGWSKELLDQGRRHTIDEWLDFTQQFQIPSADIYFTSLLALYENRNGPQKDLIERVRKMFAEDFKNAFMTTSTKIVYRSKKEDLVIHNYGSPNVRKIPVSFSGDNCHVNKNGTIKKQMNLLLGSEDLEGIENVFEWITGEKTYLWRLNKPTTGSEERAVVFGVGGIDDGFGIVANDDVSNGRPARGVVAARENH